MSTLIHVLCWGFSFLFAVIALIVFGMGGRLQFFLIAAIALIWLPPFRAFLGNTVNLRVPWWAWVLTGLLFWGGVILSFALNPAKSIYKSEAYREKLMKIYDEKLSEWPVPCESRWVETAYGKIHVIVSGPEDGFPVLLINASALSGWSWIHNVKSLSRKYRTYAVDNIGEGGKNEMIARDKIPKNGQEIADFYSEITHKLGFDKSFVVGASIGGYISTNYALYAPERVEKLVLLGSMGYGSTMKTIIAMTLAQGLPLKPVQEATFRWAFGKDPGVNESFGEWFRITMKGLIPNPVRPTSFSPDELRGLKVPTLAFFGTEDGVIGNAEKAKALAENIPDVRILVVKSGHMIGAELPEVVNSAILEFFSENGPGETG